jgi:hypothetical protein
VASASANNVIRYSKAEAANNYPMGTEFAKFTKNDCYNLTYWNKPYIMSMLNVLFPLKQQD